MDAERAKQIWEEIIQEAKNRSSPKLPDEMSIKDFMEQSGLTRDKARNFLEDQAAQGRLQKRVVMLDGARRCLYRPTPSTIPTST